MQPRLLGVCECVVQRKERTPREARGDAQRPLELGSADTYEHLHALRVMGGWLGPVDLVESHARGNVLMASKVQRLAQNFEFHGVEEPRAMSHVLRKHNGIDRIADTPRVTKMPAFYVHQDLYACVGIHIDSGRPT